MGPETGVHDRAHREEERSVRHGGPRNDGPGEGREGEGSVAVNPPAENEGGNRAATFVASLEALLPRALDLVVALVNEGREVAMGPSRSGRGRRR